MAVEIGGPAERGTSQTFPTAFYTCFAANRHIAVHPMAEISQTGTLFREWEGALDGARQTQQAGAA